MLILCRTCGKMPLAPSQASDTAAGTMGLRRYTPTAIASRTGVLHDEARHRTNRSQIHLHEQGPVVSAPPVGLTSRHAGVPGVASRRGRGPPAEGGPQVTAEAPLLRPVDESRCDHVRNSVRG